MRTTLRLDDDVAAKLRELAHRRRLPFKDVSVPGGDGLRPLRGADEVIHMSGRPSENQAGATGLGPPQLAT